MSCKAINALPVMNVPIHQVTYNDCLELIGEWIDASRHTSKTVIAANVHVVTETAFDAEYYKAVTDADLVIPDGMPLVWASRMLGNRQCERCYGPTLLTKTLDSFQNKPVRHAFYGTTAATLEKLLSNIHERWPNAIVNKTMEAPFGPFDDKQEISNINKINAAQPDILWLALGCPKQEQWMYRYRDRVDCAVIIAVGAAFDFVAGTVRQAPPIIQSAGLEWLFRLLMEPRRLWKRYFIRNPYFVYRLMAQVAGKAYRKI